MFDNGSIIADSTFVKNFVKRNCREIFFRVARLSMSKLHVSIAKICCWNSKDAASDEDHHYQDRRVRIIAILTFAFLSNALDMVLRRCPWAKIKSGRVVSVASRTDNGRGGYVLFPPVFWIVARTKIAVQQDFDGIFDWRVMEEPTRPFATIRIQGAG
jgi:hypothetical protein